MQENWHIVDNNHNNKVNDRLSEGPPWSQICYKEKEPFSWRAWPRLAMRHSSPAAQQPRPGLATCLLHPSSPPCPPTKLLVSSLFSETWQKNRCKHSWDGGDGLGVVFSKCISLFPREGSRGSTGFVRWVRAGHMWPRGARCMLWGARNCPCFCPAKVSLCSATQVSQGSTEAG